ncbi:MAG: hypothetical protein ACRDK0_06175, partial [Solirubrobacteraceae bacterium]
WYLANLATVSVYFREWRHLGGERLDEAIRRRRGYDRAIRQLIVDAQRARQIDQSVDPKYASLYILAAVNAVPDWYARGGPGCARAVAERYADMTVGLLARTRRREAA